MEFSWSVAINGLVNSLHFCHCTLPVRMKVQLHINCTLNDCGVITEWIIKNTEIQIGSHSFPLSLFSFQPFSWILSVLTQIHCLYFLNFCYTHTHTYNPTCSVSVKLYTYIHTYVYIYIYKNKHTQTYFLSRADHIGSDNQLEGSSLEKTISPTLSPTWSTYNTMPALKAWESWQTRGCGWEEWKSQMNNKSAWMTLPNWKLQVNRNSWYAMTTYYYILFYNNLLLSHFLKPILISLWPTLLCLI